MADEEDRLRIVYLDDSEVQLNEVAGALERAGHFVRAVTTVSDAAGHLHNADLVIIDYHMPGLNGSEALGVLEKRAPPDRMVLFYLYTSDRNVATGYKDQGFDGAFTGKGNTDELIRQVDAARRMLKLKRFRAQRQNAVR